MKPFKSKARDFRKTHDGLSKPHAPCKLFRRKLHEYKSTPGIYNFSVAKTTLQVKDVLIY